MITEVVDSDVTVISATQNVTALETYETGTQVTLTLGSATVAELVSALSHLSPTLNVSGGVSTWDVLLGNLLTLIIT